MKRQFILTLVMAAGLWQCKKSSSSGDGEADDGYDKTALLKNWGQNIVIASHSDFEASLASFGEQLTAYCGELAEGQYNATTLEGVKSKWTAAMEDWQQLEMIQVGPVAMNAYTLRNDIYSWPLINTCGIDKEVVSAQDAAYQLTDSDNRKGLVAIEYLLFNETLTHTCTEAVVETSAWNALSDLEKRKQRCAYAEKALAHVAEVAANLTKAWQPEQGNFLAKLTDGSEYDSLREAVNAFSDALFYLDKEVKDMKLAYPAGISDACDKDSCPELVEHPYAKTSKASLLSNLKAFKAVFTGSRAEEAAPGFDDYLIFLGREDLADGIQAKVDTAITNVTALAATFHEAAQGIDPALCAASTSDDRKVELCALYADLKAITDILKTEFMSALDLDAPKRAEGDND